MHRILCVDDEPAIHEAVRHALASEGRHVTTASGFEEGRRLIEERAFDLALVDRRMPDGDGLHLLGLLKRLRPACQRVLVTGYLDKEALMEAVNDAEVQRVFEKPFELSRLRVVVRELLEEGPQTRQAVHAWGHMDDERALLAGVLQGPGFRLDLQPIVTAKSAREVGFEGLMRSAHPLLPRPVHILEMAQRNRMFRQVGRSVAARGARWLERLPPEVRLFLNVHPEELDDMGALEDQLGPLLLQSSRVVLEITGACHERWPEVLGERLRRLKCLGFALALDDMASGQSGLILLAEAEPEYVKVDRGIVRGIQASGRKRRLVELLCTFAHTTRAELIAGGVETEEEAGTLRELGVPFMQGYLFGRPSADPHLLR